MDMFAEDSFTPTSHHYLIREDGEMNTIKKDHHRLSIVEENSDVCTCKVKTQTRLGVSELLLKDSTNNVLIKIRQLRFHLHPICAILSAYGDKNFYRVGTIRRKSVHSPLRHFTVDSIYGHYDLVEVNEQQQPLFFFTKDEHLIAHSSNTQQVSIDDNIENEQIRQFILALFTLVLAH